MLTSEIHWYVAQTWHATVCHVLGNFVLLFLGSKQTPNLTLAVLGGTVQYHHCWQKEACVFSVVNLSKRRIEVVFTFKGEQLVS